jgi:hypothetical protein
LDSQHGNYYQSASYLAAGSLTLRATALKDSE